MGPKIRVAACVPVCVSKSVRVSDVTPSATPAPVLSDTSALRACASTDGGAGALSAASAAARCSLSPASVFRNRKSANHVVRVSICVVCVYVRACVILCACLCCAFIVCVCEYARLRSVLRLSRSECRLQYALYTAPDAPSSTLICSEANRAHVTWNATAHLRNVQRTHAPYL